MKKNKDINNEFLFKENQSHVIIKFKKKILLM